MTVFNEKLSVASRVFFSNNSQIMFLTLHRIQVSLPCSPLSEKNFNLFNNTPLEALNFPQIDIQQATGNKS